MTDFMETANILENLSSKFENVTPFREDIYRASKAHKGKEYQIHYIDLSGAVSGEEFELESYQRELLLGDYYSQEDSLKRNFYLHLIVEDGFDNLPRKSLIESNKKLARKDVQTLDGLLESLDPIDKKESNEIEDVVAVWRGKIGGELPGLFETTPVTNVVERFMADDGSAAITKKKNKVEVAPFLRIVKLNIEEYRDYPKEKEHHFGKVNLIAGPNAVGKTSLLEAIELAICGKTVRSEDDETEKFKFKIIDENGDELTAVKRDNKFYRDRDQNWYGQIYPQGNQLHKSFSRFNYFDADAAARFSERVNGEMSISTALSQVVLGQEAISIFKRIIRCQELLKSNKRSVEKEILDQNSILENSEEELTEREKGSQESLTLELMSDRFRELGVKVSVSNDENVRKLNEKFLGTTLSLSLWSAAVLRFNVENYGDFSIVRDKLEKTLRYLDEVHLKGKATKLDRESLVKKIASRKEYASLLARLSEYFRSGAIDIQAIVVNVEKLTEENSLLTLAVSEYKKLSPATFSEFSDRSIKATKTLLQETISELQKDLALKKRILEEAGEKLEKISILVQEIRSKGIEFVRLDPESKECPLCDTVFDGQGLAERVNLIANSDNEESSLELHFSEVSLVEKRLATREKVLLSLESLERAYTKLHPTSEVLVLSEAINEMEKAKGRADSVENSLSEYKNRLLAIEDSGFSHAELETLIVKYNAININDDMTGSVENRVDVSNEVENLELDLRALDEKIELLESEIEENKQIFPALKDYDFQSRKFLVSEFDHLIEVTGEISEYLTISSDDSLNTVQSRSNSVKELVSSYLSSIDHKEWASRLRSRIVKTRKNLEGLDRSFKRISSALQEITSIIEDHYPEVYTNKFVAEHTNIISDIFRRIHSPREFSHVQFLGDEIVAVREHDEQECPVTRLSTGQRTALVLSVFLALNSTLQKAPKILIFDDPVSYVDDLNILSFIDFLVTQSIESDRQIFFATASDKIAGQVSSKFDFMKDDKAGFTVTNLSR
jgi:exonuclease SbcC